jgi:hypothetical protein
MWVLSNRKPGHRRGKVRLIDWGGERQDKHWQYGTPPKSNAKTVSGYAMQWGNHSSDYMTGAT